MPQTINCSCTAYRHHIWPRLSTCNITSWSYSFPFNVMRCVSCLSKCVHSDVLVTGILFLLTGSDFGIKLRGWVLRVTGNLGTQTMGQQNQVERDQPTGPRGNYYGAVCLRITLATLLINIAQAWLLLNPSEDSVGWRGWWRSSPTPYWLGRREGDTACWYLGAHSQQ